LKDRVLGEIIDLDHVQLAMPAGQEAAARAFYSGVLGLTEEAKPANLAVRVGAWFRGGALRLHLGVDPDFRPAGKAHPALLVRGLTELAARCLAAGYPPITDEPLEGFDRLRNEFNVEASIGRPQVAYKETLTRPADGEMTYARQTDEGGHYGHVKIHVFPGARADESKA
jgi:catechol 2,3-dioxygenase-like lactoylglutathione lyase family enzyme